MLCFASVCAQIPVVAIARDADANPAAARKTILEGAIRCLVEAVLRASPGLKTVDTLRFKTCPFEPNMVMSAGCIA